MKLFWRKLSYCMINMQYAIKAVFNRWKLRTRILFIFFIAVIPLCMTTMLLLTFSKASMKEQLLEASDNTVYLMSVSMNQLMENIEESTIQIISMPAVTDFLQKDEMDLLTHYYNRKKLEEDYMKPILGSVRFIKSIEIESEKSGENYSFGNNRSGTRALNKQEYSEKTDTSEQQKWFWFEETVDGREEIFLVYRREIYEFSTKQKLGTIYVEISENGILNELLYGFNYLDNSEIQLVDNVGNVIIGDEKFFNNEMVKEIYYKNILLKDDKKVITQKIEGEEYILDYSKLENDWIIVHIVPYEEIFFQIDYMFKAVMLIFVVVAVVIVFFTFAVSRSVTRPIELLGAAMEDVKKGDFSKSVPVVSDGELGRLCNDFNIMIEKINDLFRESETKQREKNEAELHSLQNQISPHFLYNILNSLACDARLRGETEQAEVLSNLISLLRNSLNYKKEYITVEEEVALLENYLRLQQFRYRDKFIYSIWVADDARKYLSLKLILQPLAENCILHGMCDSLMRINVKVEKRDSEIWISIIDDGAGITEERLLEVRKDLLSDAGDSEKHIGLKNVNKRIQLFFGERYGVKIESNSRTTKIEIHFPAIL